MKEVLLIHCSKRFQNSNSPYAELSLTLESRIKLSRCVKSLTISRAPRSLSHSSGPVMSLSIMMTSPRNCVFPLSRRHESCEALIDEGLIGEKTPNE